MNGKKLTIATIATGLMIGTAATATLARPPAPPPMDGPRGPMEGRHGMGRGGPEVMFVHMLQALDTDKDGKITKEEAKAGTDRIFDAVDADKDGSLTPGELRKYREAKRAAFEAARKADAEAAKPPAPAGADATPPAPDDQALDQLAQDDDGPAAPGPDADRGPGPGGPEGRHHGRHGDHGWRMNAGDRDGPGRWGPRGMRHGGMGLIRIADTDENGQISKAEAEALVDRMFTRMDRNKDDVISADDFPKSPFLAP